MPRALAEHEPVERPLRASTWGEGKDLRTWDSPPVADLAWGARRMELRLLRAISGGLRGDPLTRAARELLAAGSYATGGNNLAASPKVFGWQPSRLLQTISTIDLVPKALKDNVAFSATELRIGEEPSLNVGVRFRST